MCCISFIYLSNIFLKDLRSTLNVHGSNLFVYPAHGLQRRIVITQLKLTTHHVLRLEDGDARLLVVLRKEEKRRFKGEALPDARKEVFVSC